MNTGNEDINVLITRYITSLSDYDKDSMYTAKRLLKMTFDIKKSNGFLQWLKEQKDSYQ